jgi:hypothetical protein
VRAKRTPNLTIASKITLLPANIRLEVNRRLQADENPADLARWLNGLPESKDQAQSR